MKTFFQYLEIHINTKRLFEQKKQGPAVKADAGQFQRDNFEGKKKKTKDLVPA